MKGKQAITRPEKRRRELIVSLYRSYFSGTSKTGGFQPGDPSFRALPEKSNCQRQGLSREIPLIAIMQCSIIRSGGRATEIDCFSNI